MVLKQNWKIIFIKDVLGSSFTYFPYLVFFYANDSTYSLKAEKRTSYQNYRFCWNTIMLLSFDMQLLIYQTTILRR